jgi:hypothetical protein
MIPHTDNRRHARRFLAQHPAKIVLGPDAMISCTVKDISTGGARLTVKRHMDLPEHFELFIAAHDLQVRRARICWRNGDFAGVAFDADERVDESASQQIEFEGYRCRPAMRPPQRKDLKLYRTTV